MIPTEEEFAVLKARVNDGESLTGIEWTAYDTGCRERLLDEMSASSGKKTGLPGMLTEYFYTENQSNHLNADQMGMVMQADLVSTLRVIANELALIRRAKGGK